MPYPPSRHTPMASMARPQDRSGAAVKLADGAETGENKGDGHRDEHEPDDFVPQRAGRLQDRWDDKSQEAAALLVNSRSVSINVTLRHNIRCYQK
jgi:hypothetical protein